ncbi:hypothetical protein DBT_1999 [Dissulfuribacter thermophilus]|uniref:IPT/TIG domain-containing protein n=1 Tax=Dissulfuribacter thermophilus TaxID=1156395 RepID=A0A1B9F4D3_9BACT|nr:hypothetical protein [Dissulfuribacter thermophilus]OCC14684.1 hypothetical protein DBT_1999 [Dissulfuribacter thermophilus]
MVLNNLKWGLIISVLNIFLFLSEPMAIAGDSVINLKSITHSEGERSNVNEITVTWDGSNVTNLDGYAILWDNDQNSIPSSNNKLPKTVTQTSSGALPDGTWYFHIRPILSAPPLLGQVSTIGPFIIVTTPVVDSWTPATPKPGDSVTLSGFNLKEGIQIEIYADSEMTDLRATVSNIFVISGDETHASFTVPQNLSPGTYYLSLQNSDGKKGIVGNFKIITNRVLDVDGDGKTDALTDGLLILRYLFGFRGQALISQAVSQLATRTSSSDIETFLLNYSQMLDIDGNGKIDALTDGLLILRYLFGFRGNALCDRAIAVDAIRSQSIDIENYIKSIY